MSISCVARYAKQQDKTAPFPIFSCGVRTKNKRFSSLWEKTNCNGGTFKAYGRRMIKVTFSLLLGTM